MRRASKKDINHNEIAAAFEKAGCSVADTSQLGSNFPDMVVARRGRTILVEIKYNRGRPTKGQQKFLEEWRGKSFVIWTIDEAINIVNTWL